jgi:hypothetical protein
MTNLTLLSTGLVAIAMLATPAMAREHHVASRHVAEHASASDLPAPINLGGRLCIPAPRVGAFATAPYGGNDIPCEPGPGYY